MRAKARAVFISPQQRSSLDGWRSCSALELFGSCKDTSRRCGLPAVCIRAFAPGCRIQRHAANRSNPLIGLTAPLALEQAPNMGAFPVPDYDREYRDGQLRSIHYIRRHIYTINEAHISIHGKASQDSFPYHYLSVALARQLCILTAHTWPGNTGRRTTALLPSSHRKLGARQRSRGTP